MAQTKSPSRKAAAAPGSRRKAVGNQEREKHNQALVARAKSGDREAVHHIVTENAPLVTRILREKRVPPYLWEDAFHEIALHLIEKDIFQRYDPSKSAFSTYFTRAFKNAVSNFIRAKVDQVRWRTSKKEVQNRIAEIRREYRNRLGRQPTDTEILREGIRRFKRLRTKNGKGWTKREIRVVHDRYEKVLREPAPTAVSIEHIFGLASARPGPRTPAEEREVVGHIREGIDAWGRGRSKEGDRVFAARQCLLEGRTISEVAAERGMTRSALSNWIRECKTYLTEYLRKRGIQ